MEYNTQREHLPMPEYGRSVQEMVDYAVGIADRTERQRCAETIVDIMSGMFPSLKDVDDYRVKLWDHLAYMSRYHLDVDYPFPVTKFDGTKWTPEHIGYPKGEIRYRHYGRIIPELISKAVTLPEGPERQQLVRLTVAQMRKDLVLWNKEMNADSRIVEDVNFFSNGVLTVDEDTLRMEVPRPVNGQNQQRQQRPFQHRKNRKRY